MGYVFWAVRLIVLLVIVGVLATYLPDRDIVRVTNIDVTRMDVGTDANGQVITSDVRFIFAKYPDGGEMEYRNEDTGMGFPWYFKFDSARLANQSSDFISSQDNPRWAVVTHYGWRLPWLDMFPNAISIRAADGPNERLIPWFNIIFVLSLVIGFLTIYRIFAIMRRRHVDPVLARIDDEMDETAGWWRRQWRAIAGGR